MKIKGKLIEVGNIAMDDGFVTGFLIEISEEDLKSAEYLPLYQTVEITDETL